MLRGSANSVVAAVRVSMLATIMVSVRAPVRSGPASLPSSRTFMRAGSTGPVGTAAAGPGAGGRREHPVEQGALGVGQVRGGAERDGHAAQSATATAVPSTWSRVLRARGSVATKVHMMTAIQAIMTRTQRTATASRTPGDTRLRSRPARPRWAAVAATAAAPTQEGPHHPGAGAPAAEHDVPEAGDGGSGRDGAQAAGDPDRPRAARRSRPGTASDQGHEADARWPYRDIRLERARRPGRTRPLMRGITDGEPLRARSAASPGRAP